MINTQKVTVDTSEFIDSVSKLNRTTKSLITLHTDSMALFYRLFKKRNQSDVLVVFDYADFSDFISKMSKRGLDSYFYLMSEGLFLFLANYVILLNKPVDHFVFCKQTIYFESLRTVFYRKKLSKKMIRILKHR